MDKEKWYILYFWNVFNVVWKCVWIVLSMYISIILWCSSCVEVIIIVVKGYEWVIVSGSGI